VVDLVGEFFGWSEQIAGGVEARLGREPLGPARAGCREPAALNPTCIKTESERAIPPQQPSGVVRLSPPCPFRLMSIAFLFELVIEVCNARLHNNRRFLLHG
jgi:hypothetical protein